MCVLSLHKQIPGSTHDENRVILLSPSFVFFLFYSSPLGLFEETLGLER